MKTNWTSLGVDKGGRLVTSGVNGISIFFNAAGYFASTDITGPGGYGYYWSSDCYYNETGFAHCLSATKNNALCRTYNVRYLGYSIRPVKNN